MSKEQVLIHKSDLEHVIQNEYGTDDSKLFKKIVKVLSPLAEPEDTLCRYLRLRVCNHSDLREQKKALRKLLTIMKPSHSWFLPLAVILSEKDICVEIIRKCLNSEDDSSSLWAIAFDTENLNVRVHALEILDFKVYQNASKLTLYYFKNKNKKKIKKDHGRKVAAKVDKIILRSLRIIDTQDRSDFVEVIKSYVDYPNPQIQLEALKYVPLNHLSMKLYKEIANDQSQRYGSDIVNYATKCLVEKGLLPIKEMGALVFNGRNLSQKLIIVKHLSADMFVSRNILNCIVDNSNLPVECWNAALESLNKFSYRNIINDGEVRTMLKRMEEILFEVPKCDTEEKVIAWKKTKKLALEYYLKLYKQALVM